MPRRPMATLAFPGFRTGRARRQRRPGPAPAVAAPARSRRTSTSPAERIRTMSPPRRRRGGPVYYTAQTTGKLGILDRRRASSRRSRSAPIRRRMALSSARTARRGSPTAARTRSSASTRRRARCACVARQGRRVRQSQHAHVRRGRAASGSPASPATTAASSRRPDDMKVWKSPRGAARTASRRRPAGDVYYASLAGSHIARIDTETGDATVIEPPTQDQGARRVWSDSRGRIWVSYWNTGQVGMYDPGSADLARMEAAGHRAARVLGLGRRARQGLAHRLDGQRDRPLRPRQGDIRRAFRRTRRRERAPDARACRRSVGCGIGQRTAGDGAGALTAASRRR